MAKIKDEMTLEEHMRFEQDSKEKKVPKKITRTNPYPIFSKEEVMQHNEDAFIRNTNPFD